MVNTIPLQVLKKGKKNGPDTEHHVIYLSKQPRMSRQCYLGLAARAKRYIEPMMSWQILSKQTLLSVKKRPPYENQFKDETGKHQAVNDGQDKQYYIESHHEPMVGKALWDKINEMMDKQELGGQKCFHGIDETEALAEW